MVDQRTLGNWLVENWLRPLLIAAMMVCLATPLVSALEWLFPGWDGTLFLIFCFFAGLEGILSERVLSRRRVTGGQYIASRAAELVIILLLLTIVNAAPGELRRLWQNAGEWIARPESLIMSVGGVTALLLVPLWVGALMVSRRISDLDVDGDVEEPPEDRSSSAYYLWLSRLSPARDREATLGWLGEMVVWGGVVMLLSSTILYMVMPEKRLPEVAILLYCALGVALLSQARFSVTKASWRVQGIPVQAGIPGRWLLWAVLFLVGITALALILPARYLMGPVRAVQGLVLLIGQLLTFVVALFVYAFGWLASLFRSDTEQPEPPTLSLTPGPAGDAVSAGSIPSWSGLVLTLIFWVIILAIIVFAVVRVLRDRLGLMREKERAEETWWARFLAWLSSLWAIWRAWRREVQTALADRLSRRRRGTSRAARLRRFLSLRRLSPRDLVRYFYLSTSKRAAQAGQPRRSGQTPYEYQGSLDERFPDLEPDLSGLTDAFVQARYSPKPIKKQDAEEVRPLWQRIKAALRRRRQPGQPGEDGDRLSGGSQGTP